MRLLIATTNSDTRFAVELLLSQEPSTKIIGTTSDTHGLTALLPTTQPDIVIADWNLPGQSMAEVLDEYRDTQYKFIILSNQDDERDTALAAGASGFVVTGSRPEALRATYRAVRHQSHTSQRSEILNEQNER
ncbi:MAG: response regulator transcription factor [Anaerolineae bacterium]|nr:response regulator transcription factor [Anaerolineae bacterium]MCO5192354.1 response regulator transcription factor [Anaerolineae bacterium]MCO5199804.1 response regulator transcription factor [Anaerolineae bacterium]MCO5203834.1 response regulator transcription factor [Anaerolineae bacterium]